MILLDTNVVSNTSKRVPNERVRAWLNAQHPEDLLICAITVAELAFGVLVMEEGVRKQRLAKGLAALLERMGASCLSFDVLAAREYARLTAQRRAAGRPISIPDAQIAAIALSSGSTLATLNTKDFERIEGLKVIDPSA
jgi:toxin FitB